MVCTCIQIVDAAAAAPTGYAFKSTTSCIPCHTRRRMNRLKLISFIAKTRLFSVSNSDFMCVCVFWGVCIVYVVRCSAMTETLHAS